MDGELGKRIRAARVYGQMSQIEMAQKLGISSDTLIRYEKGYREVPPLTREGLARRVHELTGFSEGYLMEAATVHSEVGHDA